MGIQKAMARLFLIFGPFIGALIAALWRYKKFRTIFVVYWKQFDRKLDPKLIQNQKNSFIKKHVNSAEFIHFDDSGRPYLTPEQANELDAQVKNWYGEVPDYVTILLKLPNFKRNEIFFGDVYCTKKAITFYEYRTKEKRIVKRNERLFVCCSDTGSRRVPVHMCDQRFFAELLKDYNDICKILPVIYIILVIFCAILLYGVYYWRNTIIDMYLVLST